MYININYLLVIYIPFSDSSNLTKRYQKRSGNHPIFVMKIKFHDQQLAVSLNAVANVIL